MENRLRVEIWSDVVCPFCYIGKRKFEKAFAQFPYKDKVQLIWKSFQLAPELQTQPDKNIHQFLSEHKGIGLAQAKAMNDHVTQLAKEVGLIYNFDQSVVANTFNAHRFIHFAKLNDKQNEAEEILFRSYFTDGKNLDDYSILIELGAEIGLDTVELKIALKNGTHANDVRADIYEAQQVGIRGVPFFLFNGKYAVSGAQEPQTFLKALEKAVEEWKTQNPEALSGGTDGQSCTPDGDCK